MGKFYYRGDAWTIALTSIKRDMAAGGATKEGRQSAGPVQAADDTLGDSLTFDLQRLDGCPAQDGPHRQPGRRGTDERRAKQPHQSVE